MDELHNQERHILSNTLFSPKIVRLFCMFVVLLSASVYALQSYKLDNSSSKVGFSGEHAGMKFSGRFEKWEASLVLPPQQNPQIKASFDLSSAKTGDFTYDSTLPEGDWFDVKNHPEGTFISDSVDEVEAGYEVRGELTLKGVSKPQIFTLNKTNTGLLAEFDIDRLAYGIGVESDPEAEWVSRNITISLTLRLD
jgi:polyisoprenoid-binding protein YceI